MRVISSRKLANALIGEIRAYLEPILRYWPGRVGVWLRYLYVKVRAKRVAGRLVVGPGVTLRGLENMSFGRGVVISRDASLYAEDGSLEIGDDVGIGIRSFIDANEGGRIVIGNDVLIAVNTVFRAANHRFAVTDRPINLQGHEPGVIVVGDDVWIAANCVILPDVRIGAHSVIAAGSVVTKDVADYSICGGVPARLIRSRRA